MTSSRPPTTSADASRQRAIRQTLGMFPTGVAVVTTQTEQGERIGATVSSFNSVSLDPPLILFSIARTAKSFAAWNESQAFAVNILSDAQQQVSARFATPMSDKWQGMATVRGNETGLPLLRDALAWFECRTWARYDGGDHVIMVGEILSCERPSTASGLPLVFFNSRYAQLARDPAEAEPSGVRQ